MAPAPARNNDRTPGLRERARMTGWYDPKTLCFSGLLATVSWLFGRYADRRVLASIGASPQPVFDYSAVEGDFWFDYVSDIGDGWNPTYAIAHAASQPALDVAKAGGGTLQLPQGQVLVFGGDQVYPYPTRNAYERQAETPYDVALRASAARPEVFALPGNHDWYDGLEAFTRVFCRPDRGFAGCRTQQTRSYFALKLPSNWWLFAIDLQLGSDLDEPQVRYFQEIARQVPVDAQIILCVPFAQWIMEKAYPGFAEYDGAAMKQFAERVIERRVQVFLCGDLHSYRRHESADGVQKIVAGGGGAFLHPTHAPEADSIPGGFRERTCYPDKATSRRLNWRNLAFPFRNPSCGFAMAFLYFLSAWLVAASYHGEALSSVHDAVETAVGIALRNPGTGLWCSFVVVAFVFFTDTHVRWYKFFGGLTHGIAQIGASLLLLWAAAGFITPWLGISASSLWHPLAVGTIVAAGGWLFGSWILGVYLLTSLAVYGRHSNEAFSALRIEDFKQFLRLRIGRDGRLSIFVIAIDRVARRWKKLVVDGGTTLVPYGRRQTAPHLVEQVDVGRPR
ncbi:MAG TPA: hypothetical protein VE046_19160 [Steroidobacteraceae bacterium]|nr:hypothetical protein [Steroidobacteraceae bacterium]